ncbi:hypothetical protein [Roseiarcus sp.]|uniref:hypothetical protein n=1 Tax=Roseiarcus sp. TaxID=1969460 RepID=UPI003F992CBA
MDAQDLWNGSPRSERAAVRGERNRLHTFKFKPSVDFGRRGQDNKHRFGVDGRNDRIGVGREKSEEFVSAFNRRALRTSKALPMRPNYTEKEAACYRGATGIAFRGAVVWTQFYSKSAYREAWCPIRRSPDQRLAGAFLSAPQPSRAVKALVAIGRSVSE